MLIQTFTHALWNLISGMRAKREKFYRFVINGDILSGPRDNLINLLEAKGYQAERDEANPHEYWQFSEYLKRL